MSRNAVPVNGFSVQSLETLCLSRDLVFNVSKRCACHRIWCSESGNVVPVNRFGIQNLETLCLSANVVFKFKNAAFLSEFGVGMLETLCLSADLVFNVSQRCACQRM